MDLGISGKKAIICASSRGLGKAIEEQLAQEGVEIVINGTDHENLVKTQEEFPKKNIKFQLYSALWKKLQLALSY